MEFISQPDVMLYKFVNNTFSVNGRKNDVFIYFLLWSRYVSLES